MRKYLSILLLALLFVSCEHENTDNPAGFTTCVNFPEAPIEIMSNLDESTSEFDCKYINYFNIVQAKDNLYYMYYAAKGKYSGETDIEQGLFFAYSSDAIHWKRETPTGGSNILLPRGIQEQSVFKLDTDAVNPYRLIASIKEDGKYKLCMWKSKNGYDFDFNEKKVILDDRLYDTQSVVIPRKNELGLYLRLWNNKGTNRRNGFAKLNFEGDLISAKDTLAGNYLYNSAASYINEEYDLLQPTYMNNKEGDGKSDEAYFKAFLKSKTDCIEIDTNLNQWLKEDEKWMIAAPGVIDVKGKKYIAYYAWNRSHDGEWPAKGISRYYLIRMDLYINGKKII